VTKEELDEVALQPPYEQQWRYDGTSYYFTYEQARAVADLAQEVSSDRLSIQQECGSSWVPTAPRSALTSFITAFEPSAAPAMRWE
jgi:hypothetical protein